MTRALPALLLGGILLAVPALAHDGHDHGADAAISAPQTSGNVHLSKESQFLLKIRTTLAQTQTLGRQLSVNGTIVAAPHAQADVVSPITGILANAVILPTFGQAVRKGQVLAVVEQSLSATEQLQARTSLAQAEAALRQAEASLIAAKSDVTVTKGNWERLQRLSQVVAGKEIPQAEQLYKTAVAKQQALLAQQAQLQRQLGDLRGVASGQGGLRRFELRAPIDGVITARDAVTGSLVSPNKRLFQIIDPKQLWVEAQVFESDLGTVENAQTATVRTKAYPDQPFAARLVSLGQVVDPATRAVASVFSVVNPAGRLKIGQFVQVTIASPQQAAQLVVPKEAIFSQNGRHWLFVHTQPETFARREVVVGETIGTQTIVLQGLDAGERVVSTGGYQLLTTRATP